MKKLLILVFILFSVQINAQVSGKSKAGRLFSKKADKTEEISAPVISIFSPAMSSEPLFVTERNLSLQGKISDQYGIELDPQVL